MYLVEGNVGVGKSTLLALIKKHLPHVDISFEAVNSWTSSNQQTSLLSQFYLDPARWAYTMETFTMFTRAQEHLQQKHNPLIVKVVERSLFSGHYCFARNSYLQGFMKETEWLAYTSWFNFLATNESLIPQGFIYLQADPAICLERTQQRNRPGEETIPLEYFKQIHEQHENFLIKKNMIIEQLKNVPVLVLDASYEFHNDPEVLKEYIEKIQDFIILTQHARSKNRPTYESL